MSSFLHKFSSYVDDDRANVRMKILHIALGNPVTMCYVSVVGAGLVHKILIDKMSAAAATNFFITLLGCVACFSSSVFWMSSRPGLLVICDHLSKAAKILEDMSPSSKKSLQKKMARIEKKKMLPFYIMWLLGFASFGGAVVNGDITTDMYLLGGTPYWLHISIEFLHTSQVTGCCLPGLCTAFLLTLLASEAVFETLSHELQKCRGDKEYLNALIEVHQKLVTASMIAQDLFRNQVLVFAAIWCPALLLSLFNILSGCYGTPALTLLPISTCIIVTACEAGDILVRKSLSVSESVVDSGWQYASTTFRQNALMVLKISQRPARLKSHFSWILCRELLRIFKTMYSAFTVMLSIFDSSSCEA